MKQSLRLLLAIGALLLFSRLARMVSELQTGAAEVHDAFGLPIPPPPPGITGAAGSLGLLLLGAWFFGRLMSSINLPKISGYLLFGIFVGPDVLGLVARDQIPYLALVNDLAISLIALTAGGEIHLPFLRKAIRAVTAVSTLAIGFVVIAVGGAGFFLLGPLGVTELTSSTDKAMVAIILGTIAAAGSPAVVVAIISEQRAKGPLTQASLAIVVAMDLVLVALFAITIAVAGAVLSAPPADASGAPPAAVVAPEVVPEGGTAPLAPEAGTARGQEPGRDFSSLPMYLGVHLGGSVLAGVALGLGLAWYVHRVHAHLPIFVVMACLGIALFSRALGLEALIVALVAGILMQNIWPEPTEPLFDTIQELNAPVYCVFFAVAGAKLELAALEALWHAAVIVVALRAGAMWAAAHVGCRFAGIEGPVAKWLWTSLVSQAGVALLLAAIIDRTFADYAFGKNLFTLTVAMIAVNELGGPILFKFGLSRAGEIDGQLRAPAEARAG